MVKPDYQMDVDRLHSWIRDHLSEDLKNRDLANLINISERELHRRLQAILQMSPQQLVERLRLEQAKRLLRNTRLSNASIASEIGFKSQSYFGKRFKAFCQQTPGEYRAMVQRQMRHKTPHNAQSQAIGKADPQE